MIAVYYLSWCNMSKSVLCIVCAVIFIVINTVVLFLKPQVTYAKNDKDNYTVYYQKWINTVVYMATFVMGAFSIYMSLKMNHIVAFILLSLECLLVIMYMLIKYRGIIVNENEISVQRLFAHDFTLTFDEINHVVYTPNSRIDVKPKKKGNFGVTFNYDNFFNFYHSLMKHNVKFKTPKVSSSENKVYISFFNLSVYFPKTMYREFYQNKRFLRNSTYLFSARSVDNHEIIEGYYKEFDRGIKAFIDVIKKDLELNEFRFLSQEEVNYDGFDFTIIKAKDQIKKHTRRNAYIYHEGKNYFILYADFLIDNEIIFSKKMKKALRRSVYEDTKSKLIRI